MIIEVGARPGGNTIEVQVGSPAVKGHTKHGDTVCESAGPCQTGDPIDCDQTSGACIFEQAPEETVCTTAEGASGTCDAEGICVVV